MEKWITAVPSSCNRCLYCLYFVRVHIDPIILKNKIKLGFNSKNPIFLDIDPTKYRIIIMHKNEYVALNDGPLDRSSVVLTRVWTKYIEENHRGRDQLQKSRSAFLPPVRIHLVHQLSPLPVTPQYTDNLYPRTLFYNFLLEMQMHRSIDVHRFPVQCKVRNTLPFYWEILQL